MLTLLDLSFLFENQTMVDSRTADFLLSSFHAQLFALVFPDRSIRSFEPFFSAPTSLRYDVSIDLYPRGAVTYCMSNGEGLTIILESVCPQIATLLEKRSLLRVHTHDDVIGSFVGIEYVSIIHDSIIGAWLNTTLGRCANCKFVHFV